MKINKIILCMFAFSIINIDESWASKSLNERPSAPDKSYRANRQYRGRSGTMKQDEIKALKLVLNEIQKESKEVSDSGDKNGEKVGEEAEIIAETSEKDKSKDKSLVADVD